MRVTVCELPDDRAKFEDQWRRLVQFVSASQSELVLLPDMPFCECFESSKPVDSHVWAAAVRAHDEWEHRLAELSPALVLGTRPVDFGNERYDEAFVWDPELGMRSVHARSRAPIGATWIHDAAPDFTPIDVHGLAIGFLISAEIQAEDEARLYGEERVDLLAFPRCGDIARDWLSAARQAAMLARAPVISSNRSGRFGGQACIIAADGSVIETTSESRPFASADVTLPNQQSRASLQPLSAAPDWIDPLDTGVPPYG